MARQLSRINFLCSKVFLTQRLNAYNSFWNNFLHHYCENILDVDFAPCRITTGGVRIIRILHARPRSNHTRYVAQLIACMYIENSDQLDSLCIRIFGSSNLTLRTYSFVQCLSQNKHCTFASYPVALAHCIEHDLRIHIYTQINHHTSLHPRHPSKVLSSYKGLLDERSLAVLR